MPKGAHPEHAAIDADIAKGEWWARLFDELSERGTRRAEALKVDNPKHLRRVIGQFDRIARAVRLAVVAVLRLEAFLRGLARLRGLSSGDLSAARARARAKAEADAAARRTARDQAKRRRETRTAEVRERLMAIIEREKPAWRERDPLVQALDKRLAMDPALLHIDDLPLREAVMRICADLGITPDWSRWEAGDWMTNDPPVGAARARTVPAPPPPRKPIPAPWKPAPPPNVLPPPVFRGLPGLTARRTDTAIPLALQAGLQATPWRPPRPG